MSKKALIVWGGWDGHQPKQVAAIFDRVLREEGFESEQLTKIRAPIGLDIGAVSPEEVALAILAEIILERRGGSGAPLSSWRRD